MMSGESSAHRIPALMWRVLVCAVIVVFCIAWSVFVARRTDETMRADLLADAQAVARSLDAATLAKLKGDASDLESQSYAQIKRQLGLMAKMVPECRFLYLLGRHEDGTIFFFADSEVDGSEEESPPGQHYEEAPEEFHAVFVSGCETVEGPSSDRWGTFVSVVVPIDDALAGGRRVVLGMDWPAEDWSWRIYRAATVPIGCMVVLLAVAVAFFWCVRRRRFVAEGVLVAVAGSVLTGCLVWDVQREEASRQHDAFQLYFDGQLARLREIFRGLCGQQLEQFAIFLEKMPDAGYREFHAFAEDQVSASAVQGWAWSPVVPAAEREQFVQAVRMESGTDAFSLWQHGAQNRVEPADGRDLYYPVRYVSPMSRNAGALGFDMGSDPVRAAVLARAADTGTICGSDPLEVLPEIGGGRGMLVCRAVFSPDGVESCRVRGFVSAMLRLDDLMAAVLREHRRDVSAELSIFMFDAGREPIFLASTRDGRGVQDFGEAHPVATHVVRPLFVLGKTFALVADPGDVFRAFHPRRAGLIVLTAGGLLTALLAWLALFFGGHREKLENLVAVRTAELAESERVQREMMESLPYGVSIIDPATRVIEYVNGTTAMMFGADKAAIIGHRCHKYLCPADEKACPICDLGRIVDNSEREMLCADGRRLSILKSVKRIRIHGVEKLLECFIGIEDRIRAERALRSAHMRLDTVVANIQAGVLLEDETRHILVVNQKFCELFGIQAATGELVGSDCAAAVATSSAFVDPAAAQIRVAAILEARRTVIGEEVHLADGRILERDYVPIIAEETYRGHLWQYRDVTQSRRLNAELRRHVENDALLIKISRLFIDMAADRVDAGIDQHLGVIGLHDQADRVYVFLLDRERGTMSNTHEWCADGIEPQRASLQNVPCDLLPWWMARLERSESLVINDVSALPVAAAAERVILEAQNIRSLIVVPMIWNSQLVGFLGIESVKRLRMWSDAEITPMEQMAGIVVSTLKRKESDDELRRSRQALHELNETLEQRIAERTGKLRETEQQLFMQEKLASIGQLAAGIAHEINNPVSFVSTNIGALEEDVAVFRELIADYRELVSQGSPADVGWGEQVRVLRAKEDSLALDFVLQDMEKLFEESRDGIRRITGIVNSMRNFSRADTGSSTVSFNINKGLENTLVIARNAYKYHADVETLFGEVPMISCFPSMLNQVFLNIIVNAAQAISEQQRETRGRIVVRTGCDDSWVWCEISDDGPGLPDSVIGRVFDPFYTTKAPGKGTGLGLSISYDIVVNKHGGKLEVRNRPEGGAVFTIWLPIAGIVCPDDKKENEYD